LSNPKRGGKNEKDVFDGKKVREKVLGRKKNQKQSATWGLSYKGVGNITKHSAKSSVKKIDIGRTFRRGEKAK